MVTAVFAGVGRGRGERATGAQAGPEGEQGVAAGVGPAHAGPLHPPLDEVVGGGLDHPGAER